jgi:hypothetical protein
MSISCKGKHFFQITKTFERIDHIINHFLTAPLSRGRASQKGPDDARGRGLFERSEFPRAPDLLRSTDKSKGPSGRPASRKPQPLVWVKGSYLKMTPSLPGSPPTLGRGLRWAPFLSCPAVALAKADGSYCLPSANLNHGHSMPTLFFFFRIWEKQSHPASGLGVY